MCFFEQIDLYIYICFGEAWTIIDRDDTLRNESGVCYSYFLQLLPTKIDIYYTVSKKIYLFFKQKE